MDPCYGLKFINGIEPDGNFNGQYLLYADGNDHGNGLQQEQ
jgi:hypothetical protein